MQNSYLIIRILGNDLQGLHGQNQTLTNLEFTLKNEHNFDDTDKIFVLNRIVDLNKKQNIIDMLNTYNVKYIDNPFSINDFNKIPRIIINHSKYKKYNTKYIAKLLYYYNLYLINNNGARNFCIDYGKKNKYKWSFVFDSNSFLTKNSFESIINTINVKTEYLIIPQKRLKDGNLTNNAILTIDEQKIIELPIQEPQIAFKNTSFHKFNPSIPYGLCPKAELLRALGVKGKWSHWNDNKRFLNINDRNFNDVKCQVVSFVIRLNPGNPNNNSHNNAKARWVGLYLLVEKIYLHQNKT